MVFDTVHCLFEQSGTFKKVFEELGYKAIDYDIHKTENVDVVVDLFEQIFLSYMEMTKTIFDDIKKNDLVIAFFPCTYFSDQSQLLSRGDNFGQKKWSMEKKLKYSIDKMESRMLFYKYLATLCLIAIKKGFRLIIENPYGKVNFLKQFFPIKPGLVIKDRRKMGDVYKKPTQFFFINCEPEFKLYGDYFVKVDNQKTIEEVSGFDRSVISSAFAKNFIETYIVGWRGKNVL